MMRKHAPRACNRERASLRLRRDLPIELSLRLGLGALERLVGARDAIGARAATQCLALRDRDAMLALCVDDIGRGIGLSARDARILACPGDVLLRLARGVFERLVGCGIAGLAGRLLDSTLISG